MSKRIDELAELRSRLRTRRVTIAEIAARGRRTERRQEWSWNHVWRVLHGQRISRPVLEAARDLSSQKKDA